MKEKIDLEIKRMIDIAMKKGSINEEDVGARLLKYDASASDIEDTLKKLEGLGIKIIRDTPSQRFLHFMMFLMLNKIRLFKM